MLRARSNSDGSFCLALRCRLRHPRPMMPLLSTSATRRLRSGGAHGVLLFLLLGAIPSWGAVIQFQVTLDTNASSAQISLDALGQTDTETSRIGGSVVVGTDRYLSPTQAGMGDFQLKTLQTINFRLDFGFLSKATARIPRFEVARISPPPIPTLLPIENSHFVELNLPYQTKGSGNYEVSGLACLSLSNTIPCKDTLNFNNAPPGTLAELDTKITELPGKLQVSFTGFFTVPFDPGNPDLGTVSAFINAVGYAPVVLPPEPVELQAQQTDQGKLRIRWPKTLGPATLWSTPSLTPPQWTPVAGTPTVDGDFAEMLLPLTQHTGRVFYSLR